MSDEEKASVEQQVEEAEEQSGKVSRRDFLIGAGAGVVVMGALAGGYIARCLFGLAHLGQFLAQMCQPVKKGHYLARIAL